MNPLRYYVNDMYGSVRGIMNESAVVAKLEYYPYGEVFSMSGGGSAYTFLGKDDPGVGLLDFGPRYYNAMLGRFLSPDPMLAGASAYSYAEGNPVMLYDPSGMYAIPPPPMGSGLTTDDLIAQDMAAEDRMNSAPGQYVMVGGGKFFVGSARDQQTLAAESRDDELGRPGSGLKQVRINGEFYWFNEKIADDVVDFVKCAAMDGIKIVITGDFRTTESQKIKRDKWDAGIREPGENEPARPGTSLHEAGLAFDISKSILKEGQLEKVVALAKSCGFSWGGNFKKPDEPHFEADPVGLGFGSTRIQARDNAIRQAQASAKWITTSTLSSWMLRGLPSF